MTPRTDAGRRLASFFETEKGPRQTRWPRAFDARLAERIIEEFVPLVEAEAAEKAGPMVEMGGYVHMRWADSVSWGRVVAIGGMHDGDYVITVQREAGAHDAEGES